MEKSGLKLQLKEECFVCYRKVASYIYTNSCPNHKACISCFGLWFNSHINNFKCPYCRQSYQKAFLIKNRRKKYLKCYSNNLKLFKHSYTLTDIRLDDQINSSLKLTFSNLINRDYAGFRVNFIDLPKISIIPKLFINLNREVRRMLPLAIETDCLIKNHEVKLANLKEIEVDNMGPNLDQSIKLIWNYSNEGKEGHIRLNRFRIDDSISMYEIINSRGRLIFSKASSGFNDFSMDDGN